MLGCSFLSEEVVTKSGVKRHLFVIVAERDMEVLAVPVTSWKDNKYCNPECILNAGDHPFIKHKSWVDFSKARSYTSTDLLSKILNGTLLKQDDLKSEILDFIRARTETSEDLPEKFLTFFD